MDLSARRLAFACALPVVVVTIAATGWAGWYAGAERDDLARLGTQATLQQSITDALSALSGELNALGGMRSLPADVPEVLDPYISSSMALTGGGQTLLELSDRNAARALERLTLAGVVLRPGTRRALSRLNDDDLARAAGGRMPAGTSVADYADAVVELQGLFASMPQTTQQAVEALVALGKTPAPWRRPGFVGAIAAIWALAIAAALVLGRAVSERLRRSADALDAERTRMAELGKRNSRLLDLADAGHRVSSRTDMKGVADAVAAEAAGLLRADGAAVFLVEGDRAHPVGVAGAAEPEEINSAAGLLGRALDTGAPARGLVDSDPALPGLSPVFVLATPLIAGRRIIGAIVVGRRGETPLDDEDALALRLIGLSAATAIEGARAHDSATALALTDALTGLGNRRRLDDDLSRACAPGAVRPVGLAMIDVDHFKAYNDAHGHPAGDDVLRRVAALAASNVRDQDVVYRFGGEELCVILPGASGDEATRVAERVRAAVAAHDFTGGASQPGGRVTISVGVACDDGPEAIHLMAAADAALYRAKHEGRDRVVTAS
jgi:diguanylate cyclase (GGDEF)-like protein